MRSFTAALLGLTVALPLGIVSESAHADSNSYYNQNHRFENGWNNQDRSDWNRRDDEHAQRFGWNGNGDQGMRGERRSDEWNRGNEGVDRGDQQFGYNGNQHGWDNDSWRRHKGYGDNDRGNRSGSWRNDND